MTAIKRETKSYGVQLHCLPFSVGKHSLMEIICDVSNPKANGRCEIAIRFSGTFGANNMRPAEVLAFTEALKAVTKESRTVADKLTKTKSGAKRAKKRAPKRV